MEKIVLLHFMLQKNKIVRYVVHFIMHLFFWVAIYFFYNYFLGYGSDNTEYVNKFSMYLMPVTMIVSYFFYFFLIPNYLLKKKHWLFLLYTVYTIIIATSLIILSILYGAVFLADLKSENSSALTKTLPFIVLGVFFVVLVVVSIGLIVHNYQSIVKNEDLKNKILQTQLQLKDQELKFLKMQIHPHFLFNSLNTIYGFALKKGDEAPEMILKLSNLLDYILYQIEKPTVALENELNHLEDYIALEKIRFHDTLKINFQKRGNKEGTLIAPMLLIPFVENSFKHGSIIDGFLTIDISVETTKGKLLFQVENSIIEHEKKTAGIGLENIRKRLEMLYPNAHSLEIVQENNQFKVLLEININGLKTERDVR